MKLFDADVWLGPWPFQRFPLDTAEKLARHLHGAGISRALVSAADAVFLCDPQEANAVLFRTLGAYPFLSPVPVVNPTMGNWRALLGRSADGGARFIRLLPSYHGYSPVSDIMKVTMEELGRRSMVPIIQARIEDERAQHPLCKIPALDVSAISAIAAAFPEIPLVVSCCYLGEAAIVARAANVKVDIAFVECFRTVSSLLEQVPADRVIFGSHTPFLYTRGAVMKMEDPAIPADARASIAAGTLEMLARGDRPPPAS